MTDQATPSLRQRCDTALQSLPDAAYKTMLAALFDDLLGLAAQAAPTTADRWNDAALPPEVEQRLAPWLTNGAALHPATVNLVVRFARALSKKLAAAETKYGYSDGWLSPDWMDECRAKLMEHIAKGDPRDVAAYCAFLWHHGASTVTSQPSQAPVVQAVRHVCGLQGFGAIGDVCPACAADRAHIEASRTIPASGVIGDQ